MNEGIGKGAASAANSQNVIDHLRWIERVGRAPELKRVVNSIQGGIDLKAIQSQALLMGDECIAATARRRPSFLPTIVVPFFEAIFNHDRVS